jgi:hypothetical protein
MLLTNEDSLVGQANMTAWWTKGSWCGLRKSGKDKRDHYTQLITILIEMLILCTCTLTHWGIIAINIYLRPCVVIFSVGNWSFCWRVHPSLSLFLSLFSLKIKVFLWLELIHQSPIQKYSQCFGGCRYSHHRFTSFLAAD